MFLMKLLKPFILAFFAAGLFAVPAFADACSNGARALVAGNANATLLSVKSKKGGNGQITCEARIKISSGSTPPRIIVKKFRP